MIHFNTNIFLHITNYFFDSMNIVVFLPVSVDNVVSISPENQVSFWNFLLSQISPSPWLSSIHKSRHGCLRILGDHQSIRPAHGEVDIVGEVGDIVDGGEHGRSNVLFCHQFSSYSYVIDVCTLFPLPETGQPPVILLGGEQQGRFLSIL